LFQAFPKVVQYDAISGTFQDHTKEQKSYSLGPSDDAENEARKREKVMSWVKRERLPLFLK